MLQVVVMATVVVELFGFMGLVSIKLSAIPAVILILTIGISLQFTIHITIVSGIALPCVKWPM